MPVIIDDSGITGIKPAVYDGLRGGLRIFIIADHDIGTSYNDFALLPGGQFIVFVIKYFYFNLGHRNARRADFTRHARAAHCNRRRRGRHLVG